MAKKHQAFDLSYIAIEKDIYDVVYHKMGDYSVVLKMTNNILKYSADEHLYDAYHSVFSNIIKILGEGFTLQKHDIFPNITYDKKTEDNDDFLSREYFKHFKGRDFKEIQTYFTITQNVTRSAFFQYDSKEYKAFNNKVEKVIALLNQNSFEARALNKIEVNLFIKRFLAMEFVKPSFSLQNLKVTNERIEFGKEILRSVTLVDIDEVNMPTEIANFTTAKLNTVLPIDLFSFLHDIPDCLCIIYHQYINIPIQKKEIIRLEGKKKKHSSMPDPANNYAVEDIDNVLNTIAQTNDLLVYAHYNFLLYGMETGVNTAVNYLESKLFESGFIPLANDYNQKELYISTFPGHTWDLKHYNKFFTTSDVALCLFYKEAMVFDEDSDFKLYFTDRVGVPICIDTSEKPMDTGRINNRNKFVLGPSGSGKSFFMNSMVKQYKTQNTDVVIVDVGHSYSGLCSYLGGKYITYSEEEPITMNPFLVTMKELNQEKKDFIGSLIALLWKGADGTISKVEASAIANTVTEYFNIYFAQKDDKKVIKELSFNSFYEFSIEYLTKLAETKNIRIDVNSYSFILEAFYKGGEYDKILNSTADKSLFDEDFIVFEIDNIKGNKVLFPITTIIIMDVFLQKMRHKQSRKMLIIEEAWKAIASPMMASYILYVYKTVRKFYGEAILVTQELDDIIGNEIIKNSVINNSDTTILLDQAKFRDSYEEVASLLSLDKVEQRKIFTINSLNNKGGRNKFKEVYVKRGTSGEVYGVEVSLAEYLTYTTERKEKDAVNVYRNKYESYEEAIITFISDMEDQKLSLPKFVKKINKEELKRKDNLITV